MTDIPPSGATGDRHNPDRGPESGSTPRLPVISVVIPTVGRDTLTQAVESALNQSYPPSEILVVFDLAEIPTNIAFGAEKVRCLTTGGSHGPNAARAVGVRAAHGEAIAFLDDDDYWYAAKLEAQARLFVEIRARGHHPVIVTTSNAVTSDGEVLVNGPPLQLRRDQPVSDFLFSRREVRRSPSFGPSAMLVDAPLLERVPLNTQLRLHEDWDWLLRADALPDTEFAAVGGGPLVAYRLHPPRKNTSGELQWRLSQAWIEGNRARVSRRAYGDFLLTVTASIALKEGDHLAALRIAARAILRGRPGMPAVLFILGVAVVPSGLRERLHRLSQLVRNGFRSSTGTH